MEEPVRYRKSRKVFPSNPFVKNNLIENSSRRRTINRSGRNAMVISEEGEILSPHAGFWASYEVDSTKFVKLYVDGVRAFAGLSSAGAKVFEVMYLEMQRNIGQDRVVLNYTLIDQELTPMSEATFTRGLGDLVKKEFVAATTVPSIYWINPAYVWNGDRLLFVKEYHRKAPKKKPMQANDGGLFAAIGYDPETNGVVPPAEETPEPGQA